MNASRWRQLLVSSLGCAVLAAPAAARGEVFGGVEFPLGAVSFADAVAGYAPGTNVVPPYDDPTQALGPPDGPGTAALSLGNQGSLVVEFTDNVLVDQVDVEGGLDLYVFEVGSQTEAFDVAISADGVSYIELGRVSGQPLGIDIGPFVPPGAESRFVRVTDAPGGSSSPPWAGADVTAIGAIGSLAVPVPVLPLLAAVLLASAILAGATVLRGPWRS